MRDVDALGRRHGAAIATFCCISAILHEHDINNRPSAYTPKTFQRHSTTRNVCVKDTSTFLHILTTKFISSYQHSEYTNSETTPTPVITSCPLQYIASLPSTDTVGHDLHEFPKLSSSQDALSTCLWICYDDFIGSTYLWSQKYTPLVNFIQYFFCFNTKDLSMLFKTIFPQELAVITPIPTLI